MNNLKLIKFTVLVLLLGIVSTNGLLAQNNPMSGESFNLPLGVLDPGQTVTITFDVTVDNTLNSNQVCTQGLVSGSNIQDVLTDDPDTPAANDATCTPAEPPQLADLDYGDAQDAAGGPATGNPYPTLLEHNGARHIIVLGLSLGPLVDADPDGQPTGLADGDDTDGTDDEDGVTLPPVFTAGDPAAFVTVDGGPSGGILDAWIDFDGNGVFDDPVERITPSPGFPLAPGPGNLVLFAVPAGALPGSSYARFRLSNNGALLPAGLAPDGEVEDYQVQIEGAPQYPFMTIWAVNDNTDGKLQYYTLDMGTPFLNIEGDILGIAGDKDLEDLIIDDSSPQNNPLQSDGTFYLVNNVVTSTIYSLDFSEFDNNPTTPVTATLVGSTGIPANPSGNSEGEISSLLIYNGQLYGLSKHTKQLYEISKVDGSVNQIFTLNVTGDFRTDGMVYRPDDGIVYLLKTNDSGGESEIWKFNGFPGEDISFVRNIDESGKVEAITVHPDGFLYASDQTRLYKISVENPYIGYLADYTVDIEGMDYFYGIEASIPPVATRAFIEIIALPVELESFTAEARSSKVILNWQTATEVNNYGFEIHRQAEDNEWITLGFVEGHGNSNSPKTYSFTDSYPTGGSKFMYRLKQIDNDGQFEYSDIVEVEFVPTEFTLHQNYPNPFNPSTVIKYAVPEDARVTIVIYDVLGSQIAELVNGDVAAGNHEVTFEGSDLASGIYFYRLTAGSFSQINKMLLMK
jgi:hypothetical protein